MFLGAPASSPTSEVKMPFKSDVACNNRAIETRSTKTSSSGNCFNEEIFNNLVEAINGNTDKKIDEIFNKLQSTDKKVAENTAAILEVDRRVDDLEQYTRRHNLRFLGIPEKPRENTDHVIIDFLKKEMNVTIGESDIDRSHRLGTFIEGKNRQIIVKFISYKIRDCIFKNKKLLKGKQFRVYEDLTKHRLELYKLAMRKHGMKRVWTADGNIYRVSSDRRGGRETIVKLSISDLMNPEENRESE